MKYVITVILGILLAFMIVSLVYTGGWLIYHDGPHKGKVVEAETNEPIEGVAVVAIWYLERYGGAGGPIAKLLNAKETVTNKSGEFVIPLMLGFHWWPFSTLDKPNVTVFKPGYTSYKWYRYPLPNLSKFPDGIIRLTKTKTREERIESVSSLGICDTMTDKRCSKKLPNIWKLREREWKDLGLMK